MLYENIISFGSCKKLQTDNGTEFRNNLINNYCIENNVEHIYSPPYHPRANGTVEAVHKTIQKFVNDYFYISDNKNFNINTALLDAIEHHNNNIHSSTKYTPFELRDIINVDIIESVKINIKNTVGKK